MDEHTEHTPSSPNALQGLLSNPALLQTLAGLMKNAAPTTESTLKPAESASELNDASTTAPVNADMGTQEFSDGISRVLSDPAMMAKLPQMIELLKPMLVSSGEKGEAVPASANTQAALPKDVRCRNDLLLALKPFLSHERAAAVDAILRLSHLGNVLQTLK